MWADELLSAERHHLLRLIAWSALCIVIATSIFLMLAVRRVRSALLQHFAMQLGLWALVIGALALLGMRGLHLRDVGGASLLDRRLWLGIGLDIGYVGIGATLALAGRMLGRRPGAVGAGLGIVLHGLALLVIDLQFAVLVSR